MSAGDRGEASYLVRMYTEGRPYDSVLSEMAAFGWTERDVKAHLARVGITVRQPANGVRAIPAAREAGA